MTMMTMHVNGRVFKINKNLTSKEMLNTYAQRFEIDLPSYTMNEKNKLSRQQIYSKN